MQKTSIPKLLVVDDAADIRDPLCHYLAKNGVEAVGAASADEARAVLHDETISLIILDLMMPGEDGLSFYRALMNSSTGARIPVIMLTALHSDANKIRGLDLGADDYVTKPFNPRELLSRIHAVLRRGSLAKPGPARERRRFAGIVHDPQLQAVLLPDGAEVGLTSGENRLLEALLDHAGGVLSREDIAKLISRKGDTTTMRAADNCIFRLRRKLGDNARAPKILLTDWGGGYRIVDDVRPDG
ncbi:response regulator transcription factor [Paracoccus sp. IB05]|uniref:response regulator transcription factor n=1 Tax=Paracoccus sp. IB05 TaxID=2779367 RepID=UPI0018E7E77D|nr:response regulator transcription factor [Paracoccus sp. IB05]MBJ2149457.1 response regulator transcription factor [Paracoccus sp. IB05]